MQRISRSKQGDGGALVSLTRPVGGEPRFLNGRRKIQSFKELGEPDLNGRSPGSVWPYSPHSIILGHHPLFADASTHRAGGLGPSSNYRSSPHRTNGSVGNARSISSSTNHRKTSQSCNGPRAGSCSVLIASSHPAMIACFRMEIASS